MKAAKFCFPILAALILQGCAKKSADVIISDAPEVNAPCLMELSSDTLSLNTEFIEGMIISNVDEELSFGEDFRIQVYNDTAWVDVVRDMMVNSLAYIVRPDSSSSFKHNLHHNLYDYKAGKYRILNDVMATFELEFFVTEDEPSDRNEISVVSAIGDIEMKMDSNTIPVATDTLTLTADNNSVADIYPYEDYFIERYDESTKEWMHYYQPNSRNNPKRELTAGESSEFKIALNSIKRPKGTDLYRGRYFFFPGKYRIRKYVDIPVSAEFVLSGSSL